MEFSRGGYLHDKSIIGERRCEDNEEWNEKNNTNKNKGAGLTKDIDVSEEKDTQNNVHKENK